MSALTNGPLRWAAAGLLAVALAGCSGPSVSGSDQPGAQAGAAVTPGPAGAAQRLTVATSSIPDIAAALDANGVGDAENWAKIVKGSGPYPAGAAGQQKLSEVLRSHQVSPEDAGKIANTLVP